MWQWSGDPPCRLGPTTHQGTSCAVSAEPAEGCRAAMGEARKAPSVPKALPHPPSHRLRLAASQAIPSVVALGVLYAIKDHFWKLPPDNPLHQSGILGCMMGQIGVLLMSKPFLGQTMALSLQRAIGTTLGGFITLALQQASPSWALMGPWLALLTAGAATAAAAVPQALVLLQVTVATAYVVAIQSTYLVLKGQAAYAFAMPKVLGILAGAGFLLVAQLLTFPRTATHQLMYSLNRCLDHTAQLAAALAAHFPGTPAGNNTSGASQLDKPQEAVVEMSAASSTAGGKQVAGAVSMLSSSKDHQAAPYNSSSYSAASASIPPPGSGLSSSMPLDSGLSARLPPMAVRLLADVWTELGKVEGLLGVARHEVLLGRLGPVRFYTVRVLAGPSPLPRPLVRQLVVQLRAVLRLLMQWNMEAGVNPAALQVPPFLAALLEGQGQRGGERLGVVLLEALQELVGGIPLSAGLAPPLARDRLDALEQRLAHLVSGLLGLRGGPGAGPGAGEGEQPQQEGLGGSDPPTMQQQGQQQQRQGLVILELGDTCVGVDPNMAAGQDAAAQAAVHGLAQQPLEWVTSPTPDELVGLMRCSRASSGTGIPVGQQAPADSAMPPAVSAQLAQQLFRQDSQQPAEVRAATWYTLLLVWRAVVLLEQVHDTLHQLRRQLPGVLVPD